MEKIDDKIKVLKNITILYVEDDKALREKMVEFLTMLFKKVYSAKNGNEGLLIFHEQSIDLVLTDIKMPLMDGLTMSKQIRKKNSRIPIVITTAFSEVDYLIKAIELGIDKFIKKPINDNELINALYICSLPLVEKIKLESLKVTIQKNLTKRLGKSSQMQNVIEQVQKVAPSDFSVIIQGETGVGKSVVAEIIHDLSSRQNGPFLTVDIGSIPESLIESELFGYKKGAFTNAHMDKKGFLECAQNGTLFVDELENLSLSVQAKLLRVVEEKQVTPLGSNTAKRIDLRIICATNVDIRKMVQQKQFREDLFYRLFEFEILIPPLRQRPEDIKMLTFHFFNEALKELNKKKLKLSEEAVKTIQNAHWGGNVRELKNLIRRIVLISDNKTVVNKNIEDLLKLGINKSGRSEDDKDFLQASIIPWEQMEIQAIEQALKHTSGKRMKAASLLQIDYKKLNRKMKKYGIE